jgi:hypothetical protein
LIPKILTEFPFGIGMVNTEKYRPIPTEKYRFGMQLYTSRFPLTMAAGGFGPYHRLCLWTDDAPSKRKVVTPTSGEMMPALGFVSYHWGRELLVAPPPQRICWFVFFGKKNSYII